MTERLIERLDRFGAEAGINTMTPEIRRFAMLVGEAVVAQWPQRPWVGLTAEEIHDTEGYKETREMYRFARAIEAKLKEKNT